MKNIARYMKWQKKYSYTHYIIYLLKNAFFSLSCLAFYFRKELSEEKVNVIFLSRSEGGARFKNIIDNISSEISYVKLREFDPPSIIKNRMVLFQDSNRGSFVFHIYELYSNYLLKKYNPEVIVTDSNGSILHPFLTKACSLNKAKHIHIAHSIPTKNYLQFSLISYDYYMVYGRSSCDYIKQRPIIYGSTKFIFTGSHHINNKVSKLNKLKTENEIFLLLGSGPSFEKKDKKTKKYYEMVIKYISNKPNSTLVFKPHPRSNEELWNSLVRGHNDDKFAKSYLFPEPIEQVKVAFCGYTNAILDVAKLGIVPCLMSDSIENDVFNFKDYMFDPVSDFESLKYRTDELINNQNYYKSKLSEFINYHLEDISRPENYIYKIINEIVHQGNADRFVDDEI